MEVTRKTDMSDSKSEKEPKQKQETTREFPPRYGRHDIQEEGLNLDEYVRIYEDPYRGPQKYLPYQFRLAWLRNTYPQGIIRQLEPELLAEGRQLIGGMEFYRTPDDSIGERVYCQVSRDETGPELDTRDLFEVLRQKLINAITIGLGFSLPVPSAMEQEEILKQEAQESEEQADPRLKIEALQDELLSLRSQLDFAQEVKSRQELELRDLQQALRKLEYQADSHKTAATKTSAARADMIQNKTQYDPAMVAYVRQGTDGTLSWVNQEGGRISTPVIDSVEEAWNTEIPLTKGEMVTVSERLSRVAQSPEGKALLETWLDKNQKISSRKQFPGVCAIRYLYYHGLLNDLCKALGLEPWREDTGQTEPETAEN
ncbi:hypothetical protein [Faecalibaculum rodentium]|uniref:hypothetical protein n=1 Tax=Faecalibaculum rodentium TaxID=1702221 RepID=UPI0023F2FB56|nr:hypothetical protein [Faecalibaculum rodentium]